MILLLRAHVSIHQASKHPVWYTSQLILFIAGSTYAKTQRNIRVKQKGEHHIPSSPQNKMVIYDFMILVDSSCYPPKINMSAKKGPCLKEISSSNQQFSVDILVFWGVPLHNSSVNQEFSTYTPEN